MDPRGARGRAGPRVGRVPGPGAPHPAAPRAADDPPRRPAGAVPRRAPDQRVRRRPRRDVGPPRRVRAAVSRRRDEDPHVGATRRRRGGDGRLRAAAGGHWARGSLADRAGRRRFRRGRRAARRPVAGPGRGLGGRPGDGLPVVVRRTGLVRHHLARRRLRDALGRRPVPVPVAVAGVRGGRGLPVVEARPHGGPGAVDQLPDARPARGGTAWDAARRAGGLDDRDVARRGGLRAGAGEITGIDADGGVIHAATGGAGKGR